ncbi:MAG: polysaccharide deacetylase family protein [Nitrososphaeria archaeon]|jgi:peptidoglycan/xylan/chitin deacetylase (PgdA/CDA1 family)
MSLSSFLILFDKAGIIDHFAKFFPIDPLAIVMYHNIGKNEISWLQEKPLPSQILEMQIKYLKKVGYSILPLGEALCLIRRGESPKRIAVLTFDDGYVGVYKYAFPIMRKYGIRCTVFVPSSFVKYKTIPWYEQLAFIIDHLDIPTKLDLAQFGTSIIYSINDKIRVKQNFINKLLNEDIEGINLFIKKLVDTSGIDVSKALELPIMLNHDELKEMVEYGIEIGGHGFCHVSLPILASDRLQNELYEAYSFVREYSRSQFMTFAYPFGTYSEGVVDCLKKVGFSAAVTMENFVNNTNSLNLYKLGRIPPYTFDQRKLASFKYGLIRPKKILQRYHFIP